MTRIKACLLAGSLLWIGGLGVVASLNIGSEWTLFGKTFFDILDYLTSSWLMPLGGLLMAIFSGWILNKTVMQDEIGLGTGIMYQLWLFTMRYITPLAIIVVFLNVLGVISLSTQDKKPKAHLLWSWAYDNTPILKHFMLVSLFAERT